MTDSEKTITTNKILIHATNVSGIGAIQVVRSLVGEMAVFSPSDGVTIHVSDTEYFKDIDFHGKSAEIVPHPRTLPNSLSRALECLLSHVEYRGFSHSLVLGDIPLCKISNQTVLVHQPYLISPEVNCYSSRKMKYVIGRKIFKSNLKYVEKVIVQTGSMKDQLLSTYSELQDRITVISHPAPTWLLNSQSIYQRTYDGCVRLFYPAAGYSHKNHGLLAGMAESAGNKQRFIAELIVTLDQAEASRNMLQTISWVKNIGRVSTSKCLEQYHRADALFYPSLLESYGLPLVEAMTLGLPVLCSDLPYARWLCEEQAIYFQPTDPASAWLAVAELHNRLNSGWQADWRKPLEKLPKDWSSVAKQFIEAMGLGTGHEDIDYYSCS